MKKIIIAMALTVLMGFALFMRARTKESGRVDLVVFSYDRPLQLYAFLESTQKYITGLKTVSVIYRSSGDEYTKAYQQVAHRFPDVSFLKQSSDHPQQDFKPLVMKASFESPTDYIMYGVDDIVMTDYVDMQRVVAALEATGAYAFFLRLGLHVDECYMLHRAQKVPPVTNVSDDVYAWTFSQGDGDWAYPNSQDMTVYRKKDIEPMYKRMNFVSPNSCEGQWSMYADVRKQGLCFGAAKIVNIPMNLVQTLYPGNRNMNLYSVQDLLAKFNDGLKMDIAPLFKAKFKSVHVEYEPTFVKRA